jgi:pyruvate kinase
MYWPTIGLPIGCRGFNLRTKIVCTLGPATDDEAVLRKIIRAGMDVARLNFSHGKHDEHLRRMALVRRSAQMEGAQVAILGDLQGPKFRVGALPAAGLNLVKASELILCSGLVGGVDENMAAARLPVVPFPHAEVIAACQPGQRLLVDDGALVLHVVGKPDEQSLHCKVVVGGLLLARKGVSAPGTKIAVSPITHKDDEDIAFAVANGIDAIALSFVQSAADVVALRTRIQSLQGQQLIVSKIEKPQAIADLAGIIAASDAVMVARGDLGVESSPEEVPFHQKQIIHSCLQAGVPVITATQMLQSMVHAPVPTRAEASDVANAVLDGTDAVMLSAETASGDYPVEAVETLARIASRAEEHAIAREGFFEQADFLRITSMPAPDHTTQALTEAAVRIAHEIAAAAIVCTSASGFTVRMMARHRPDVQIVGLTSNQRAYQYTTLMWGVRSVLVPEIRAMSTEEMFAAAVQAVEKLGFAQAGDQIVITAGVPMGRGSGTTNLIKVHTCN